MREDRGRTVIFDEVDTAASANAGVAQKQGGQKVEKRRLLRPPRAAHAFLHACVGKRRAGFGRECKRFLEGVVRGGR